MQTLPKPASFRKHISWMWQYTRDNCGNENPNSGSNRSSFTMTECLLKTPGIISNTNIGIHAFIWTLIFSKDLKALHFLYSNIAIRGSDKIRMPVYFTLLVAVHSTGEPSWWRFWRWSPLWLPLRWEQLGIRAFSTLINEKSGSYAHSTLSLSHAQRKIKPKQPDDVPQTRLRYFQGTATVHEGLPLQRISFYLKLWVEFNNTILIELLCCTFITASFDEKAC